MKFHFVLLGVLCVHALAGDERLEDRKLKRYSVYGPTTKGSDLPDASAVVVKKTQPSQSSGASLMSSCSSAIDGINVGVQGILAKNGVEYVYLPMTTNNQAACFESYNNSVLVASDLASCCDAAAEGGHNSFRFDGGGCTGFNAWISPIYTQCAGDGLVSPGLFVAKQKLSNFTSNAPTFDTSSSFLALARIMVVVTNIVDACPYSKTLKVTTYSETRTTKLDFLTASGEYKANFYMPELCNDSASTDERTVTVSILDSDGSELISVEKVLSSALTGRHLLSNDACVLYSGSPLRAYGDADSFCNLAVSSLPFGDGFLSFADIQQKLDGLAVPAMDFWAGAERSGSVWVWYLNKHNISLSLFNLQSLNITLPSEALIANVTDKLLYIVEATTVRHTVCFDAPYMWS